MKICILSPHYPPETGGVSDHTKEFIDQLLIGKNEVLLATHANAISDDKNLRIISLAKGTLSYLKLLYEIKKFQPDFILIQFTPLSFAPHLYGITLPLCIFSFLVRCFLPFPVLLYAHETGFPPSFSLRGFFLGVPHSIQFFLLSLFAHKMAFSHKTTFDQYSKILFWKSQKMRVIPIYSNIKIAPKDYSIREKFKLPANGDLILYFGGAHDMNLLQFVTNAFDKITTQQLQPNPFLVMAGVGVEDVTRKTKAELTSDVFILGYLQNSDVSLLFQEAKIVLAPFGEGVNTRRGSFMAGIAHGKAVVTTSGWCTKDDHPWESYCMLSDSNSPSDFSKLAMNLLANGTVRAKLETAAQEYYNKHFSKEVTVKEVLSFIRN